MRLGITLTKLKGWTFLLVLSSGVFPVKSWFVGIFIALLLAPVLGFAQSARPRQLAPGILTVIPSAPAEEEMFSGPRPLVEIPTNIANLEKIQPNFAPLSGTLNERAKAAILRRTIWNLEFAFKPLRMITIDEPQPTGKMQRKLVWYMVYRVKNNGQHWKPIPKPDEFGNTTFDVQKVDMPLRFFPQFVLQAFELDNKQYLDRIIPAAMGPIKNREFPKQEIELHDSVTISTKNIEVSDERTDKSVWGVVCWEDVDPRIDYLGVFIQGLTNAYKFEDPPNGYKKGELPGSARVLTHKTLQLNFWRPGDTIDEAEEEIRFGVRIEADPVAQAKIFALYGVQERLDWLWIYR